LELALNRGRSRKSANIQLGIQDVLQLFPFMNERLDSAVDLLSGGEQQMIAIGRALLLKPDLLIIDDMGMKQLPRRSGECLLEIIMRRHENRSTMMTSNRPLEDWAKLIGDVPAATAILDRFLQHATIINITGKSYRLRAGGAASAHGGNAEKANTKGRRNTADDEGLSPPEDTATVQTVSSGTGVAADPRS